MEGDSLKDNAIPVVARAGYAARAVVYLIIGGLATVAAFGSGGQTSGSRDALKTLLGEPFGRTLLVIVGIGLFCYSVWRTIQAFKDPDNHGTDGKGLAIRASLLISAILHVSLGIFAISLVFTLGGGSSGGSGGGGQENFSAWLMQQPFGVWLVGLIGLAVIGAGIAHGIKGYRAKFERYMRIPESLQPGAQHLCRFGLVTRGVVLVIVGGFFLIAAYQADPSEAGGLAQAFDTVRSQPFGRILLGVVAVGLFAFGLYSALESAFRRVDPRASGSTGPQPPR